MDARGIRLSTRHGRTFRRLRICDIAAPGIGFRDPDKYVNPHARYVNHGALENPAGSLRVLFLPGFLNAETGDPVHKIVRDRPVQRELNGAPAYREGRQFLLELRDTG